MSPRQPIHGRPSRAIWGAALIPVLLAASMLTGREVLAAPLSLTAKCVVGALPLCVNDTTFGDGAFLTVSGTGFEAGKWVATWVDVDGDGMLGLKEPRSKGFTDGSGAFFISMQVTGVAAGVHLISAGVCPTQGAQDSCPDTASLVSTAVTVTMSTSPYRFGAGSTIGVTGAGFAPTVPLNVWFDGNNNAVLDDGEPTVSTTTTASGGFSAALKIIARPGSYFVRAGPSTNATASSAVEIATCWFQICMIDGAQTLCLVGNSPSDFFSFFSDCKRIESNYSEPTPLTPTGGFDLNNKGPRFVGAGALAAATNDMLPLLPPPTGCIAITAAIANANGYGNIVPDGGYDLTKPLTDLEDIACSEPLAGFVPIDLVLYMALEVGHEIPDAGFLLTMVAAIQAAALAASVAAVVLGPLAVTLGPAVTTAALAAISGMGLDPATAGAIAASVTTFIVTAGVALFVTAPILQLAILGAAQAALAMAAVAGAIACGHVDYFCDGADITATILKSPDLQQELIPIPFMQPPFMAPPDPNPCRASVGAPVLNGTCWGSVIGWAKVVCKAGDSLCETTGAPLLPKLAVPGSSGVNNLLGDYKCATGNVVGMSIGYDGDLSFDLFDNNPELLALLNYHNFLPGPGGSDPPGGIDIEIPVTDLPIFQSRLEPLRPGMSVRACGWWVADMHMLWNELHPLVTLTILSDTSVTISSPAANADLPTGTTTVTASIKDVGGPDTHTCTIQWDAAAPVLATVTVAPTSTTPGTCVASTSGLAAGAHTATISVVDSDSSSPATASVNFTINAPPVLVLPGPQSVQYGGGSLSFGISATDIEVGDTIALTASGLPAGLTFTDNGDRTGSVSGSPSVGVGSYTVTFTASDGINTAVSGTVAIAVTPKPASISAVADRKVYGSPDPVLTTTNSGFLAADLGAGKITFSATRAAGESVGTYTITPAADDNGSGLLSNYTVTINTADFVVTPKPASVSAVADGKLYGDPDPVLTTTNSGFLASDLGPGKITFSATRAAGESVGTYTITPAADDHGSGLLSNYTVTLNTAVFTITVTPASLCNLTKRYFQSSAKYQALPAAAKEHSDLVAGAACGMLLRIDSQATPNQKAAAISAYELVIDALVRAGWLTPAQGTFLQNGADAL